LLKKDRKIFRVVWIKTNNTFWQGTTKREQKSLTSASEVSLVAGNVTGGGGKATTTKTYRHRALVSTTECLFI
jgi:hypothetical protein